MSSIYVKRVALLLSVLFLLPLVIASPGLDIVGNNISGVIELNPPGATDGPGGNGTVVIFCTNATACTNLSDLFLFKTQEDFYNGTILHIGDGVTQSDLYLSNNGSGFPDGRSNGLFISGLGIWDPNTLWTDASNGMLRLTSQRGYAFGVSELGWFDDWMNMSFRNAVPVIDIYRPTTIHYQNNLTLENGTFWAKNVCLTNQSNCNFTGISGGGFNADQQVNTTSNVTFDYLKLSHKLYMSVNGTGVIQINNSENTSSTFIVDTVNDRIGIGTSTPSQKVDIVSNGAIGTLQVVTYSSTGTSGSNYRLARSRGTPTNPSNLSSGDRLGQFQFSGYGGGLLVGATVQANAQENWNGTAHGTNLVFAISKKNTISSTNMLQVDDNGINILQGITLNYATQSSDYIIRTNDLIIGGDTSSGTSINLTLPDATTMRGKSFIIKDIGGTAGTSLIGINTTSGQNIEGTDHQVISTNYGTLRIFSDGVNWFLW